MPYYQVRIKKNKPSGWRFAYDLTKEQLENKILVYFRKQEPFMFKSAVIRFSEIDAFGVTETDISSSEILKKTKTKRLFLRLFGSRAADEFYLINAEKIFSSGRDVTSEVVKELSIPEKIFPKLDTSITNRVESRKKDKVFVVHGRDDRQALLLQKYLKDKLKLDAIMFDDLPDKGRTIIEQIEFIQNNTFYALVIVTPDDVGCLSQDVEKVAASIEGLKTVPKETVTKILELLHERARQNVVFELGLFIGALGRENVCCLKQKNVREKPSDIDGILYKEFDKEIKEIFHELADELKTT